MKRALALIAAVLLGLSALAICGPYFGVENVGLTAQPELIAGWDFGGRIGNSDWTFIVDAQHTNEDIVLNNDPWIFDLDVSLGWEQAVTVNQTGSLVYGCIFTITQTVAFEPLRPGQTVEDLALDTWSTGLFAEGYVGPLSAWFGCELDLMTLDLVPTVGFLVDW